MSHVIGIDLGTTSARVGVMQNGSPVIIENSEGQGTTPCYVALTTEETILVGEAAKRYALKHPERVAYAVKRFIGRKFDDPAIEKIQRFMPYKIVPGPDNEAWVELGGHQFSPTEISAYILEKMKKTAETFLGETISQAVLTVPANFTHAQQNATKYACKLAGLEALRIVKEPTAAALAFGANFDDRKTLAVYDLGGGTFDVTIMKTEDGVFEVLATSGNMLLGGEDFDYAVAGHLAQRFEQQYGIDLMDNPISRLRLKQAAETIKLELSFADSCQINLPFITSHEGGIFHLSDTISRAEFETLIEPILLRSIAVCRRALSDALSIDEMIDQVILVGGSTRIPIVNRMVAGYFKQMPYGGLRREDAVCLGVTIQAGVLQGDVKDVLLLDVISENIGVECGDGQYHAFCAKNLNMPTKRSQNLQIHRNSKGSTQIGLYTGPRPTLAGSNLLLALDVSGHIPENKSHAHFEVAVVVDANGIISLSARNIETDENLEIATQREPTEDPNVKHMRRFTVQDKAISSAVALEATPKNPPRDTTEEAAPEYAPNRVSTLDERPSIFLSYAHEDANWASEIEKSLSFLRRSNKIKLWIDRQIPTGEKWETAIFDAVAESNVAILLLSNDFLNSDYIIDTELPLIFAEKERRRLTLIPIVARPCPFQNHDQLRLFQFFNSPDAPLSSLEHWKVEQELSRLALEIGELLR